MIFNKPCYLITKAKLRNEGFFRFIEAAPIAPSRQLKIEARTKVDLSGDFDTKVQACSAPMLSAIAEGAFDIAKPHFARVPAVTTPAYQGDASAARWRRKQNPATEP